MKEMLYSIKSQQRTFRVIDDQGRRVDKRANGVAITEGALVLLDVYGEPLLVVAGGRWQSVSPA